MPCLTVSSVIDAPIEKVWERIRDFNGLHVWHPRLAGSEMEGGRPATEIGAVRRLTTGTGAIVRERLLAFSDADHSTTYSIIEHPAPISNHAATLRLERVTDGERTFAVWSASFDAPPGEAEAIAKGMGDNVFQGGFNALKSHFARS